MDNTTHNLDINEYSFEEILGLFDLNYDFNEEELKKAKKKVLYTHPDKSKLPPKYFLFYKKAFDFVLKYHEETKKQKRELPTNETIKYEMMNEKNKNVEKIIQNMDKKEFNSKFNKLYEEHMMKKRNNKKNEWFESDEPVFDVDLKNVNVQNMGKIIETIKTRNNQLIKHREITEMKNLNFGTSLYEDEDEINDEYVSCDIFSKLKYDDLRKVHKDKTVFDVSEKDFEKTKKYNSVEHLSRERTLQNVSPIEKSKAENMLLKQNQDFIKQMLQKQHKLNLKEIEYNEKNKNVMAGFLRITEY